MKTGKRLGIFLLTAVILTGCANGETQEDIIVELQQSVLDESQKTEVVRGNLQVSVSFDAQAGPRVEQLSFAEEGSFGEFCVKLGDTVKAGDILAMPATEDTEKAIKARTEELESLKVNYDYQKTTMENNIAIAKLQLEDVYNDLKVAQYGTQKYTELCIRAGNYDQQIKRLELLLEQLEETYELDLPYYEKRLQELLEERNENNIVAPFDGTVVALEEAKYGEAIDTDLFYVALADTSVCYVRCEELTPGMVRNDPRIVFWRNGKEYEAAYIFRDADYYRIVINNDEDYVSEMQILDPEGEIAFGDYGKVKVILEEKENVLLLPEVAVVTVSGSSYVYKDVDGRRERVGVKTGDSDGIRIEIQEGLEEGDVVYVQE